MPLSLFGQGSRPDPGNLNLTNYTPFVSQNLVFVSHKSSVSLLYFNLHSLLPKMDSLRSISSVYSPDVCIVETWLDDTISNCEIFIQGYSFVDLTTPDMVVVFYFLSKVYLLTHFCSKVHLTLSVLLCLLNVLLVPVALISLLLFSIGLLILAMHF